MKTVVILSGQIRSFSDCLASQRWQVYRRLTRPVFFVSCAKDEQAKDAEKLRDFYPEVNIEVVEQPESIPLPRWQAPRFPRIAHPYPVSASYDGILKQLWSLNRAWQFAKDAVSDGDMVIRIRPDLLFRRFEMPWSNGHNEAYLPAWSRWGGVNDRFALLGSSAAFWYFSTFQRLQDLCDIGAPLHPESLVMGSLEMGGVKINNTLVADFSTLRINGEFIGPDYQIWDLMDLTGKSRQY